LLEIAQLGRGHTHFLHLFHFVHLTQKKSLFYSNPQSALFTFCPLWAKMGGGLGRPPARAPIVQDPFVWGFVCWKEHLGENV